jgi:hypothetical protein
MQRPKLADEVAKLADGAGCRAGSAVLNDPGSAAISALPGAAYVEAFERRCCPAAGSDLGAGKAPLVTTSSV